MMFGAHIEPAESVGAADWVDTWPLHGPWTVGGLVPERFESVLRMFPPDPCEGWWLRYRDVFTAVATVGRRHTSTPDRAWYAVWEGHGFDTSTDVGAGLAAIPRFVRPSRSYYLLRGTVDAVDGFRYPGSDDWRNPDLWWPDDRRWLIATDVDLWSLYVGGPEEFLTELTAAVPTSTERVGRDDPIELED